MGAVLKIIFIMLMTSFVSHLCDFSFSFKNYLLLLKNKNDLFICLCWVLVAAHRIFGLCCVACEIFS